MSDKPAGNIKTALERFQSYCAAKGIPEKSSLAHIHKISQFEEHERKELRAAYEALKKENAEHKATISNLSKAYERESNDCLKALEERDYWYDKADSLADKISKVFDVPVGEHSNVNCPIVESMKILCGEYVTKFDKQIEALKAENEAQAKRIAELEDDNKYLKQLSFSAIDTSNQYEIKKKTLMRSLALLEKVTKHFTRVPSTLADSEIRSEVHAFLSESKNGDSK